MPYKNPVDVAACRKRTYWKDVEKSRAYQRRWSKERRAKQPGFGAHRALKYIRKHPDKVKLWKRAYYLRHRERLLAKQKLYYNSNRDKCVAASAVYAEKHPEVRRKCNRNWYLKNKTRNAAKEARRRIRMAASTDSTAEAFYLFVRSKPEIPCYYCGALIPGSDAHIDHVIAISRNGNHASDNLCASCKECNLRKKDKLPSQLTFLNQPLLDL